MLSVIITAKEEAQTIGRAVLAMLKAINNYQLTINNQKLAIKNFEIIVVAPDEETLHAARKVYDDARIIKDKNIGKAAAMNLAVSLAKGDDVIFSDGDVYVDEQAISELFKVQADAVSGRPALKSINNYQSLAASRVRGQATTNPSEIALASHGAGPREIALASHGAGNKYRFWQECLLDEADKLRSEKASKNEFLAVSGYLFLLRKKILEEAEDNGYFMLPENLLAEDEYLSYYCYNQGYKIGYGSEAKVYIEHPANFRDWVKQKTRTLAGSYQIPKEWRSKAMRSFWRESIRGIGMWKSKAVDIKSAWRLTQLFLARIYAWFLAFIKLKILRQGREKIWQRVESTKQGTINN